MNPIVAVLLFVAPVLLFFLAWRWGSRVWALPCPSLFAWALSSRFYERITQTEITLQRIGLRPGQRVLEIGPGPGRLLIHAAQRVSPGGEAVGIDIQPGMVERLNARAKRARVTNLTAILGDATEPIVPEASFDVVFLVTTLGEIPDRRGVMAQCYRALKPSGVLSVTEMFPDPHYQSRSTVKMLAAEAGFRLESVQGAWWLFTMNFRKPAY
jgi:ubiquinone/menaquinone biosynthesis C-methylase UbiE